MVKEPRIITTGQLKKMDLTYEQEVVLVLRNDWDRLHGQIEDLEIDLDHLREEIEVLEDRLANYE